MRLFLCILVAMWSLAIFNLISVADDQKPAAQTVTGVLIDQACGAKMIKKDNPETAAADHTKSCCQSCASSGYAVISGKQMFKFDENGNKLAKDFLAKTDKDKDLKVTVTGTEHDDNIDVTSLAAAPEK